MALSMSSARVGTSSVTLCARDGAGGLNEVKVASTTEVSDSDSVSLSTWERLIAKSDVGE